MTPTATIHGLGPVGKAMCILAPDKTWGLDLDAGRVLECNEAGGNAFLVSDDRPWQDRDLAFVCVGTPTNLDGEQDPTAFLRVMEQIAEHPPTYGVVIRSTILPQWLPRSYPVPVAIHPEFLRVRRAVRESLDPPFLVVGIDPRNGVDLAKLVFAWWDLVGGVRAPRFTIKQKEAILLKYACNAFHAAKVEFANEIADIAATWGVDPEPVMRAFCADTRLNISKAYLDPGHPYGGSCLPKDLKALIHATAADVDLLRATDTGNDRRVKWTTVSSGTKSSSES